VRIIVDVFQIGKDKGAIWKFKRNEKEDNSEEHNNIIMKACANTDFETKEEQNTAGRRKKEAKSGDIKEEYKKVAIKLRKLKNIPMYGAKIKGDFKSLLLHQRMRHLKYNISYDDDNWKPFTMCGFDGAKHTDSMLGTTNIISFNTQIYCKRLQDRGISTAFSQNIMTFMQLCALEKIDVLLPYLNQHYTEKLAALMDSNVVFGSNVLGFPYEVHDMKIFHNCMERSLGIAMIADTCFVLVPGRKVL
jgi:hypothetical protein